MQLHGTETEWWEVITAVSNGADQFSAFAALTGFDEVIREHEKITEVRREMAEDAAIELSEKMGRVRKGSKIKIIFYHKDGYKTVSGAVENIDFIYRTLRVAGKRIFLDDVADIENLGT